MATLQDLRERIRASEAERATGETLESLRRRLRRGAARESIPPVDASGMDAAAAAASGDGSVTVPETAAPPPVAPVDTSGFDAAAEAARTPAPQPSPPAAPVDASGFDQAAAGLAQQPRTSPQTLPEAVAMAVPRGFVEGAESPLSTFALGERRAATKIRSLVPQIQQLAGMEWEAAEPLFRQIAKLENLSPAQRTMVGQVARDVFQGRLAPDQVPTEMAKAIVTGAGDLQQAMRIFAEETFPIAEEHEQRLPVQVARAGGTTGAYLASRLLFGPAGLAAFAGGAGSGEAVENAIAAGASDEEAARAAFAGVVPGLTDMLPIERLLRPIEKAPGVKGALYALARRAVEQGLIEGTQESVQQFMQNAIGKLVYAPDADLQEGIRENGLVGFLVGALFGGAAGVMQRPRERERGFDLAGPGDADIAEGRREPTGPEIPPALPSPSEAPGEGVTAQGPETAPEPVAPTAAQPEQEIEAVSERAAEQPAAPDGETQPTGPESQPDLLGGPEITTEQTARRERIAALADEIEAAGTLNAAEISIALDQMRIGKHTGNWAMDLPSDAWSEMNRDPSLIPEIEAEFERRTAAAEAREKKLRDLQARARKQRAEDGQPVKPAETAPPPRTEPTGPRVIINEVGRDGLTQAEREAKERAGRHPKGEAWAKIGQNAAGEDIYEDDKGVRYVRKGGIRYNEPVQMMPTRDGVETGVNRTRTRNPRFITAEEAADQTPPPVGPRQIGIMPDTPEVSVFRNFKKMKAHPDYAAAKGGDMEAAIRLVQDMATDESADAAREKFGKNDIFVPVIAEEESGRNAIPIALADYYSSVVGAQPTHSIVQSNRAFHTGAKAMERLIAPARFEGPVQTGQRYVLVDDVTVMGSTLADLAEHIHRNGGVVAGVITLVNGSRTRILTPERAQISEIERRFGNAVQEILGVEPTGLTAAEAVYLLNFRDADSLRDRAATARRDRKERLGSKGVRPPAADEGAAEPVTPPSQSSDESVISTETGGRASDEQVRRDREETLPETPTEDVGGARGERPAADVSGRPGRAGRGYGGAGPRGDRGETEEGGRVPGGAPTAGPRAAGGGGTGAERPGIQRPAAEGRPARKIVGHNYRIDDDQDFEGRGPKERARDNITAIRLLKTIEEEGRPATAEEQRVLAGYVGWGGLVQAFPKQSGEWTKGWADVGTDLQEILTEEEYAAARASTPNAHYTSLEVVRGMWDFLDRAGFKDGRVLEPGMGVGYFFGTSPGTPHLHGVELDQITGRIAKMLYPRADIRVQGYQDAIFPEDYFDVVIGNVPFADVKPYDPKYNKAKFSLHDYYFVKSLALAKPGGYVAFITSRYTMDKQSDKVRKAIAEVADLVGAVRLPNNAFKGIANTEVTTDIIILRKRRPGEPAEQGPAWMALAPVGDENILVNEYFADNPDHMAGVMSLTGTMYGGNEPTLEPKPYPLMNVVEPIFSAIDGRARQSGLALDPLDAESPADHPPSTEETAEADDHKEGAYFVKNGALYQKTFGVGRKIPIREKGKKAGLFKTDHDRVMRLAEIRDAARHVLATQVENALDAAQDAAQDAARAQLNRLYDAFVKKYGPIMRTKVTEITRPDGTVIEQRRRPNLRAFADDPDGMLVASLEDYDIDSDTAKKRDMFRVRVVSKEREIRSVENPQDALLASLDRHNRVDLDYMQDLLNLSRNEVLSRLEGQIYLDPESREYITADEYLSGNVRDKLALAQQAAAEDQTFNGNVTALESIQPEDLPPSQIEARLGSPWIPKEDIEQFVADLLEGDPSQVTVSHNARDAEWVVRADTLANAVIAQTDWGTEAVNAVRLVEHGLNLRQPTVTKIVYEAGDRKEVKDIDATLAAQERLNKIKERFRRWIWDDPDRGERLARFYNDRYNNIRLRSFDGSHLTFPGMKEVVPGNWFQGLRPHQANAVWRIMQSGNSLLAHVVGSGKTMTMVAAGMEMKRVGLVNKPMYVVPNHMLEQFASETLDLYPTAKIMVANEANFHTRTRRLFVNRVATENWDAVIITHSAFGKIPISPAFERRMLRQVIDEYEALIREANTGSDRNLTKRLEKQRLRWQSRLQELSARRHKDTGITFEETGIDFLFVDEAHEFKNLETRTKIQNVKNLNTQGSQKAFDLWMKVQYLDSLNADRAAVFATGTPISNSMVEMYTMQRYLQPRMLDNRAISHFDAWAAQFGEVVTATELDPTGAGYRIDSRFAKFVNVPELLQMYRDIADVQTADMLDLPTPDLKGGTAQIVEAKPSPQQQEAVEDLKKRLDALKGKRAEKGEDNPLKVVGDGRHIALDIRTRFPDAPDYADSKVNIAVDRIHRTWADTKKKKLTQLVFMDLSTPGGEGFSVYDDMRSKLIQKGIPAKEVAFIHDAKTADKKARLFADVRAGKVRILFGSTAKMGVGTNVQKRLYALHHMDAPWRPADVEQRDGRIMRQGNENEEVEIIRYVTSGTFDAYMWQTLETKHRFIQQVMTGDLTVREMEDLDSENSLLDPATVKAIASGNPLVLEKAGIDSDIARLSRLAAEHRDVQFRMRRRATTLPDDIKASKKNVAAYDADIARREDVSGDAFKITIKGKVYTELPEAGDALIDAVAKELERIEAKTGKETERDGIVGLGKFAGFDLILRRYGPDSFQIWLSGSSTYSTSINMDSGLGAIQRLRNTAGQPEKAREDELTRIAKYEKDLADIKQRLGQPFEYEERLEELQRRSAEIEEQLTASSRPSAPQSAPAPDRGGEGTSSMIRPDAAGGGPKPGKRHKGPRQTRFDPDKKPLPPNEEPLRREEILKPLAEDLGVPLYTGRVKGKSRLGFFRRGLEEVRIKNHNDIATAAHEFAHLLDRRFPEIRAQWSPASTYNAVIREELKAVSYDEEKLHEGFAEFVRLWATEMEEAQRRAPTFYAWFERFISNNRHGPALRRAQQEMHQWYEQSALDRARSKVGLRQTRKAIFDKTFSSRFRQGVMDDLQRVLEAETLLTGKHMGPVYQAARLTRGVTGVLQASLFYGAPSWRGGDIVLLDREGNPVYQVREGRVQKNPAATPWGLEQILAPVSDDLVNFGMYAVGSRAQFLKRQNRENLFANDEIQALLALRTPDRQLAFEEWNDFNRQMLDFAQQSGLISGESRAAWETAVYLPFWRVTEDRPEGGGAKRHRSGEVHIVRRLRGGTANIGDPIANMHRNVRLLLEASVYNNARRQIVDMIMEAEGESPEQPGGAKFLVKIPRTSKRLKVLVDSARDGMKSRYSEMKREELISLAKSREGMENEDVVIEAAAHAQQEIEEFEDLIDSVFDKVHGSIAVWQHGLPALGDNIIAVMRDGKAEYYEVADPLMFLALTSMPRRIARNDLVKFFAAWRRLGQRTVTWSIDFAYRNIFRDQMMASTLSTHGYKGGKDAVRGLKSRLTHDPAYQAWLANGGGMASLWSDERAFEKHLRTYYEKHGILYRTVVNAPRKFIYFVDRFLDSFETATRLGEFKRALEHGKTLSEGTFASREISTDFAMRGDPRIDVVVRGDAAVLGTLYDTVLFLKAGVVGVDRVYRGFRHYPNKGQVALRTGMMAVATLLLYALNMLYNKDEYDALEEWDKDAHWHVWFPTVAMLEHWLAGGPLPPENERKHHFRFPKPWEIGGIATITERAVDGVINKDPEQALHAARTVQSMFRYDFVPFGLAPMVEQVANRQFFFDRPIEPAGVQDLQPWARATVHTSETMRALGESTRDLPRALQLSPARMEHLVRAYFNTWGLYGLTLADQVFFDDVPDLRISDYPLMRSIVAATPAKSTRYVTEFYDMLQDATELRRTMRAMDVQNRPEIADELEYKPGNLEYNQLSAANETVQGIRGEIRTVINTRNLDDLHDYVNSLSGDPVMKKAAARLRLSKSWNDLGKLKRDLIVAWIDVRNEFLKDVVQDVETQRAAPEQQR